MKKILYNGKEIFNNEKSCVTIGVLLTTALLIVSMIIGYNLRAKQIEEAHARYKQERLESYMAFNQLMEKYANMAQNIETGREELK